MGKDFLVINDILIPDMEQDSLLIFETPLDQYIRMISGRLVAEERGKIWTIQASFEEIPQELFRQLTASLRGRWEHLIAFLPPDGGKDVISSRFYLTKQPNPKLHSWQNEYPEWGGLEYEFEEIEPH